MLFFRAAEKLIFETSERCTVQTLHYDCKSHVMAEYATICRCIQSSVATRPTAGLEVGRESNVQWVRYRGVCFLTAAINIKQVVILEYKCSFIYRHHQTCEDNVKLRCLSWHFQPFSQSRLRPVRTN